MKRVRPQAVAAVPIQPGRLASWGTLRVREASAIIRLRLIDDKWWVTTVPDDRKTVMKHQAALPRPGCDRIARAKTASAQTYTLTLLAAATGEGQQPSGDQ